MRIAAGGSIELIIHKSSLHWPRILRIWNACATSGRDRGGNLETKYQIEKDEGKIMILNKQELRPIIPCWSLAQLSTVKLF